MEIKKFFERKTVGALLAVGLGVTALAACDSGPGIERDMPGVVVEHDYKPPLTTLMMAGKVPMVITYPEHYYLDIQQCDRAEEKEADVNGCITAWEEVSQETYEQFPDGSEIVFSK